MLCAEELIISPTCDLLSKALRQHGIQGSQLHPLVESFSHLYSWYTLSLNTYNSEYNVSFDLRNITRFAAAIY